MKRLSILAIFVLILLVGCTQTAPSSDITIKDFSFNPAEFTAKKGASVSWSNEDSVVHKITMDSGLFEQTLNSGEQSSYTFNEAGTYSYHCGLHPKMKGKIIITE